MYCVMGWFFETENDRREKMIISYAGTICMHIRNIASIIDRDGALNYGNISSVSNDIQSMTSIKEKMESEITLLSQSKIQKLYLPWIDGRNIPFHMWAGSYQMFALQLQKMIEAL